MSRKPVPNRKHHSGNKQLPLDIPVRMPRNIPIDKSPEVLSRAAQLAADEVSRRRQERFIKKSRPGKFGPAPQTPSF
jgi:hypothetical protein